MKVKKDKYGHYVSGTIELEIKAYVTNIEEGDEMNDTEALKILIAEQGNLAGSNDGSELLANADIKLSNK